MGIFILYGVFGAVLSTRSSPRVSASFPVILFPGVAILLFSSFISPLLASRHLLILCASFPSRRQLRARAASFLARPSALCSNRRREAPALAWGSSRTSPGARAPAQST